MGICTGVEKRDIQSGRQIINENATIIAVVGSPLDVFCVRISQEDKPGRQL
jgi:hypothetical protein